ncbi:hypothetical protein ACFFJ7_06585 [Pseudochelatococcus lubricantis]|uniref:hypothetical protein n=1 Tax=Pseudochelatococcus lubricantis TaxID=1538102 RepID=UPI0035E5E6B7
MTIPGKRGRPMGTAPNRKHDERLLQQAARNLLFGLSPNATAAFRSLLDEDDPQFPAVLRRLQRQWQQHGDRYLEETRRNAFAQRWRFDADRLEKASPEFSQVVDTFAASSVGQAVLRKYGQNGIPADPLSLGIVTLWDEIVRNSAIGPLRAEELFKQVHADWSATGLEPDEAFLRRFAELCLAQADRLKAHVGAGTGDGNAGREHDHDDGAL